MMPAYTVPIIEAQTIIAALRHIVGTPYVKTQPDDLAPHLTDWRKRYRGSALCAVLPADTAQVQTIVNYCRQHRLSIVTQGGNTSLCGGATPQTKPQTQTDHADDLNHINIVLLTHRLNTLYEVDTANHSLTVGAGMTLQQVQQIATEAGLHFPLSLASEGSCTIGGNVATNAGGTAVLRYGNTQALVLGLEAVLADGSLYHDLRPLYKNNIGYRLTQLLIGSEGTLGIITAVTLKLVPAPRSQCVAWLTCSSIEAVMALFQSCKTQMDEVLTAFEVMNHDAMTLLTDSGQRIPTDAKDSDTESATSWHILLECRGTLPQTALDEWVYAVLNDAIEDKSMALVTACVIAQDGTQAAYWWALREMIPTAQSRLGLNIKHDISLPLSAIAPCIQQLSTVLQRDFAAVSKMRLITFGHIGDGNVHYNVAAPIGMNAEQFLAAYETRIQHTVHDVVMAHGGSFSAEHGIGQYKKDMLAHYHPQHVALMRQIKHTLDPMSLFNPHVLL
jgi:FAD/FMN-containing dehydrogenase